MCSGTVPLYFWQFSFRDVSYLLAGRLLTGRCGLADRHENSFLSFLQQKFCYDFVMKFSEIFGVALEWTMRSFFDRIEVPGPWKTQLSITGVERSIPKIRPSPSIYMSIYLLQPIKHHPTAIAQIVIIKILLRSVPPRRRNELFPQLPSPNRHINVRGQKKIRSHLKINFCHWNDLCSC